MYIILTRSVEDNNNLQCQLEKTDLDVQFAPLSEIRYLPITPAQFISEISTATHIVFTSRAGVRAVTEFEVATLKVAVIGPSTANEVVKVFGQKPALVSEGQNGRDLAQLIAKDQRDSKVLIIRGVVSAGTLQAELKEQKIPYQELVVYENIPLAWPKELKIKLQDLSAEGLIFPLFNGLVVDRLAAEFDGLLDLSKLKFIAIGHQAAEAANKNGWQYKYLERFNLEELIEIINTIHQES